MSVSENIISRRSEEDKTRKKRKNGVLFIVSILLYVYVFGSTAKIRSFY